MTTLTKTQIAALKAAEAGGDFTRFRRIYWRPQNHTPTSEDRVPDQKITFGTQTINALASMGYLSWVHNSAWLTELGRAALVELKEGAK